MDLAPHTMFAMYYVCVCIEIELLPYYNVDDDSIVCEEVGFENNLKDREMSIDLFEDVNLNLKRNATLWIRYTFHIPFTIKNNISKNCRSLGFT